MYTKTLLSASILLALSPAALAEEVSRFDEVVVSATRTSQTIENTAASVAVVSSKDIEANMAKDVAAILEYTPGVSTNSSSRQGVQTINIRGVEGNRIKIMVDGVTQGQAFDGGPYSFVNSSAISIDPDMVKSVEVIKGAASSLHGSDAIGGVVAFDTKDPRDFLKGDATTGGQAKLSYSSEDKSFSEHIAIANRSGNLETLVAYTRRDGQEQQNFADRKENYSIESQDSAKNDLLLKLQYQLSDAHRLEFFGEALHNKTDSDIAHSSYKNYHGQDTTKQYRLGIKHIWLADSAIADSITSRASWQSKEDNGLTHRFQPASSGRPPYTPANADNQQTKDYFYNEDKIELETQLDKLVTLGQTEHNFIYGLSFASSDISNTNTELNSDPATPNQVLVYTPDATDQKIGLFVQDEITLLSGNLIVTPGLRYDSFSTDPGGSTTEPLVKFDDSALTSRLGALYRINNQHSAFAQVSQGFRAPNFTELYYTYDNIAHNYVNDPNPYLKSEKSLAYELGYRHNTNSSATEISAFYSDYDDFIEQVITKKENKIEHYSYVNLSEATIKGIELSNQLKLDQLIGAPNGISTRLAASYSKGEDGNGRPLNSVNPWNVVAALNYDDESTTWGTSLKLDYTAAKSAGNINRDKLNSGTENQVELPSATIVDITAYFKPMQDVTITAGIFNLTDKEYYRWNDIRGKTSLDNDYSQAERNYAITAKYEF
ncbi:MAG: TonB-dependent hemoglobin/transferrin/lactoferrin family receptor [Vibrio anguillarum]|nr:TonB-dependent hemoglobin/transferrin/lactoferrin family receptor [Vibrio anguillarum]